MGFDEMKDKAQQALNTDQGEKVSDEALQKGATEASSMTGGKYDEQIQKGEQAADEKIGEG
jgi:hypothetical protein